MSPTSIPRRTASTSLAAPRPSTDTTVRAAAASILRMTSRTSSRITSLSIHPSSSRPMAESSDSTHRRRRAQVIIPVPRRVAIAQPTPLASHTRISEEQDIHANTHCRRRAQGRLESERGVGAARYFVFQCPSPTNSSEQGIGCLIYRGGEWLGRASSIGFCATDTGREHHPCGRPYRAQNLGEATTATMCSPTSGTGRVDTGYR
ncbi:hypothetical protein B0H13DRAFT_2017492 [Mycena leptocephala]|nr:hypothetical protein B0H13DRAFT_2017492 [Mycena leptocephala]